MGTNTGIGIGIGIPFRNNALGGDNMYFPPELKARMIGVWDNYGKKNTDADRNIIKNKIPNAGGDLEILNSAYRLNSGFGGYSNDFQEYTYHTSVVIKTDTNAVFNAGGQLLIPYPSLTKDIPSFKIKVSGLSNTYHFRYYYRDNNGVQHFVNMGKDGNYELPICYNVQNSSDGTHCGFANNGSDIITVEILPAFEGALVTDGINDIIASIKTLEEWNIGDKGITIVSMIHQINTKSNNFITTNNIRTDNKVVGRNIVSNIEKTGIYGWYKKNIQSNTINVINNILGDENDYTSYSTPSTNINSINNSKFYVQGYAVENGFSELSSVAHYWTFAVLDKATEDEINLIIAKYNLDRTLRPDILCNIAKQGITNDNHAEFNDKLIDYSGNGRDIQMNNLAWKGGSGIAAKPFETIKDYAIISDEPRQKLTIYNEFSYKVKSNIPNCYWTVQSIIKDNTSYQVTIITDKDCYWINSTTFTNNEGNKESIRKEYPVKANTPTQVIICGLNEFEYPEDIEPTTAVSYVNLNYAGEVTVTFIPSCKGGLLLDGVNDFVKVTGLPIYKDYTVVADREVIDRLVENADGGVALKGGRYLTGAFCFDYKDASFSFGTPKMIPLDTKRFISYQSKYVSNGIRMNIGKATDNDELWIGRLGNDERYSKIAIRFLMSFPYSMSKFLIERQLKKHKLGTFYPNMVEFRPVIKANANYKITCYQINSNNTWKLIKVGDYIVIGAKLAFQITFDNDASELKEVVSPQLSDIIVEKRPSNLGYNIYSYITSKSPQKINITIDEYIRFEDIVQPYPALLRFNDENGNKVSWGGKFKVGSTITRIGSAADSNLLPNIYNIFGLLLNGNQVTSSKVIVEKTMVFKAKSAYIFDNNEPKCILSPSRLRIPNSSYKLLGYIPDISGHGNNGVIHNSAYAEGSGVNEDGSYQFDGVDDFVTIPTLSRGGKQVLMKVNLPRLNEIIYDQRKETNTYTFAILTTPSGIAYDQKNSERITYIDGILNTNIIAEQLMGVTHNIVVINSKANLDNTRSPIIGRDINGNNWSRMRIYDFMLFDNISTDDKIKELNEYVGIEAKVELPPYYWDAYGKTNLDGDKATIQQRGIAVGDFDLTNNNLAYEGMSGYNGYPVVFGANKTWANESNGYVTSITSNTIHITNVLNAGLALLYSYVKYNGNLQNIKEIPPFKIKIKGLEGRSKFIYKYLATSDATKETNLYLGNGTHELPKSFLPTEALINNAVVSFSISPIEEGVTNFLSDITIEVLPEYENGLVYDGITDYSKNANIPALDDFTAIIKREWLKKQGCPLIKGSKVYEEGNGNALLLEWDKAYNFVFYKRTDIMEGELPDNISFITPTNYNGNVITRGSEQDTNGICIAGDGNAGFANMVFYKLILYPKTIPLLQINFLKNLMERDEIIDLTNPIFIKNE